MEVTGTIHKIFDTEDVGTQGFQKRNMVLKTEEQYPQLLLITFFQDKCNLLNIYSEGDEVKVSISLRGKEWVNKQGETKYFNELSGYAIFDK